VAFSLSFTCTVIDYIIYVMSLAHVDHVNNVDRSRQHVEIKLVEDYHSATEYQLFYFSYKIWRKHAIYMLYVNIYISFSLNGHIKTKNGYFHEILKNNRDKQQIKFLIFGTFFCLMPVKSESLKISSQTNMIYIHQQFF
jgi:hypothetical protein